MCTEDIVGCNSPPAETTVDGQHLSCLTTELLPGHSITHPSGHQFLEMCGKFVSHLTCGAKTILVSVLDRAHQDLFHLSRQRWSNLARSRVLGKIKYQERIVLGI